MQVLSLVCSECQTMDSGGYSTSLARIAGHAMQVPRLPPAYHECSESLRDVLSLRAALQTDLTNNVLDDTLSLTAAHLECWDQLLS